MSLCRVTRMVVKNNPSPLDSPFLFEITFESLEDLECDIEWRMIYVGALYDKPGTGETELDCVAIGPIKRGALAFEFSVMPPDFTRMNPYYVMGMQAIVITGSYRSQEFVRIGYFLNNAYVDPALRECPPCPPELDKVARCIIADQPRVTRFPIEWDSNHSELVPPNIDENQVANEAVDNEGNSNTAPAEVDFETGLPIQKHGDPFLCISQFNVESTDVEMA